MNKWAVNIIAIVLAILFIFPLIWIFASLLEAGRNECVYDGRLGSFYRFDA